jgi:hypothetical protein
VTLSGTGLSGAHSLSTPLAFANQNIGGTQGRTVTLSNSGAGRLNVASILARTAPFALATAGSCGQPPFELSAGAAAL